MDEKYPISTLTEFTENLTKHISELFVHINVPLKEDFLTISKMETPNKFSEGTSEVEKQHYILITILSEESRV